MKTAQEYYIDKIIVGSQEDCINALKQYAKEVATQALKDAAENATTKDRADKRDHDFYPYMIVDKQSILDTEIKLP